MEETTVGFVKSNPAASCMIVNFFLLSNGLGRKVRLVIQNTTKRTNVNFNVHQKHFKSLSINTKLKMMTGSYIVYVLSHHYNFNGKLFI